jgi:hypothetical protein
MHAVMGDIDSFRRQLRQVMDKHQLARQFDDLVSAESRRLASVKALPPEAFSPAMPPAMKAPPAVVGSEEEIQRHQSAVSGLLGLPNLYQNSGADLLLPGTPSAPARDSANCSRENIRSGIETAAQKRRLQLHADHDRRREDPLSPSQLRELYKSAAEPDNPPTRASKCVGGCTVSPVRRIQTDGNSTIDPSVALYSPLRRQHPSPVLASSATTPAPGWRTAAYTHVLLSPEEAMEESRNFRQQLEREREVSSMHRHRDTTRGYYEEVVEPMETPSRSPIQLLPIDPSLLASPSAKTRRAELLAKELRERVLPKARQAYGIAAERQQMEAVRIGDARTRQAARDGGGAASNAVAQSEQKERLALRAQFRIRTPVPTTTAGEKSTGTCLSARCAAEMQRSYFHDDPSLQRLLQEERARRKECRGDDRGPGLSGVRLHRNTTTAALLKSPMRARTPPPSSRARPAVPLRTLHPKHAAAPVPLNPCRTFVVPLEDQPA